MGGGKSATSSGRLSSGGGAWNGNQYSVNFDGTDDYLDLSSASGLLNEQANFSISFWFFATSAPGRLICSGTSGTNRINISMPNNTFFFGVNTGLQVDLGSGQFNQWNHMVCTKEGIMGKIYQNGTLKATSTSLVATTTNTQGNGFSIGRQPFATVEYGTAKIDEVAVFSSVLSSSDVTSIYNSGVPNDISSLSPVGWWRMGDNESGTGTTITDQGSGGNNGTLTNGPTFSTSVPS